MHFSVADIKSPTLGLRQPPDRFHVGDSNGGKGTHVVTKPKISIHGSIDTLVALTRHFL